MKKTINKSRVLRLDYDIRINSLVIALLAYYPILYAVNIIVNKFLTAATSVDSIIITGLLAATVLMAVPVIIRRIRLLFLIFLLFFVTAFIFGLLGGDEQAQIVRGRVGTFFGTVFPYLAGGMAVRNYTMLRKGLRDLTPVVIVAITLWIIIVYNERSGQWQNNMGVSYCFLPWALLAVENFFSEKKALNAVWMIVSAVDVFIFGTRGPLFLFALFVVVSLLRYSSSKRKVPICFLIICVITYLYINFYDIALWLDKALRSENIILAGLQKVLYSEDITNGRESLIGFVWWRIFERPIFGWGIFGDRTSELIGTYVHFLPLELALNYGIIFGFAAFIFCIYKPIRALVMANASPDEFSVIIMLFFVTVGKLMMSGSYLEEPLLYLMLGIVCTPRRRDTFVQKISYRRIHENAT